MILRLYRYFIPYWRWMALSLLFVVLFAVTSALLVYLATTLISALFQPETMAVTESAQQTSEVTPLGFFEQVRQNLSNWVRQSLLTGDRERDLFYLSMLLIAVTFAKNLFFFLQGYFAAYVEQGITKTLRDQIFTHLQRLSLQYFHRSRTGHLISTAMNDVLKVHETFNNTLNNLIRDPLLILIFFVIMLIVSWQLTLVTLVVLPIIFFGIYRIGKLIRGYSSRAQEAIADISSSLEETINSIRIVRAYAAERYEIRRFMQRTSQYFRVMLKINRIRLLSNPFNELLGVAAFAIILWWGGRQVLHQEFLGVHDFLLFLFAMFSIINPAKSVSTIHVRLSEGLAAARRIFDLLDTQPAVVESPNPIHLTTFKKEIAFTDVSFAYNEGEPVVEDINLTVSKGQIVALVGPSGSGKSTLIDLMCRFHDPDKGQITIDGVDIRDVSFVSLRGLLGIVTQETILFNDTVANNIAYPASFVDREKLIQAAKAANAHSFVIEMPQGYDTVIGNRGMMVSGGERQRLAIARALMKDPEILIFDEATSSLDTESERLVQEAIDHLMAGRTTLVVAHRLSTILHADLILVLKDGHIVERGRHEELLRLNGVYRRLYDLQFEKGNAAEVGTESAATGTLSQRD